MHRFLISAAHKSSGKTTLSVGVAAALSRRGLGVQTFKKGPDYIDPMWLTAATDRRCRNLDFNLSTPEQLQTEFARHGARADVCLVEGNHGLYDGLDLEGSNSNAALTRLLELPVVLVLDTRGMTRGIAPLILGYQAFDRSLRIVGVILSRVGGSRHESKLRAVIEHYTDVPVLGAVHEDAQIWIAERHLGLTPTNEDGAVESRIALLAEAVNRQVDLDQLLVLTAGATPLPTVLPFAGRSQQTLRIGIARDRAFGFYYADDIDALERAGVELVPFDTLRDAHLPAVDGLLIGGGFPELFARELEANAGLRGEILAAINNGMPAYAECGGLMYLGRTLTWRGETRRMVGAIGGDVVMHERAVGRGYVSLVSTADHPWSASQAQTAPMPAHEFHHSSIEGLSPQTRFAYRVTRGFGVDGQSDGIVINNLLASYSHLRSTGGRDWAANFVAFVREVAKDQRPRFAAAGQ